MEPPGKPGVPLKPAFGFRVLARSILRKRHLAVAEDPGQGRGLLRRQIYLYEIIREAKVWDWKHCVRCNAPVPIFLYQRLLTF